jgi:DNA-binding MarR family transcriptional regulator
MKDYSELSLLMERIVHKYMQAEKKKRTYGTNLLLTRAEIHTVSVVGDYSNLNITTLAQLQGITKGAASQMIYKLVDKGLVEKRVSPDSDTEVVLSLTELGKTSYEAHKQYHRDSDEKLFSMVKNVPEEQYKQIIQMLSEFEQHMDERLEE